METDTTKNTLKYGDTELSLPDWVEPGHFIAWDESGDVWVYNTEPRHWRFVQGFWCNSGVLAKRTMMGYCVLAPPTPEPGPWTEQLYVLEEV